MLADVHSHVFALTPIPNFYAGEIVFGEEKFMYLIHMIKGETIGFSLNWVGEDGSMVPVDGILAEEVLKEVVKAF